MCSKGLRVMGFAVRDVSLSVFDDMRNITGNWTSDDTLNEIEKEKTFLGLVALKDPQRDNIRDTLAYAESAQLKIRLVSGDHFETCRAFACDVGLITKEQYDLGADNSSQYAIDAKELRD